MKNQAVLLVGGRGSRLGDITSKTPKPMLDIGDKKFIQLLIEEVARHGYEDIILLCGYLAESFYSKFDGIKIQGARVRCVVEDQPMGTGGALLQAAHLLDESFLLLNGDSFFDFNLLDLNTLAVDEPWLGKVALRHLNETGRYGVVILEDERIISFAEKKGAGPGLINGGVYFLKREILDFIHVTPCSLENDILPRVIAQRKLFGRAYSGYFIDIGIPEDLGIARQQLANRSRPAVFFDRDGVLNQDTGYTHKIDDFKWMKGAIEAIKLFNDRGWFVFVVTNQAGIARGYYDENAVIQLHAWMQSQLRKKGAHIDAFYFCPHHPEGVVPSLTFLCNCRKPEPGMLHNALQNWPIDLENSLLIGDKDSDIGAANAFGINGFLYKEGILLDLINKILF